MTIPATSASPADADESPVTSPPGDVGRVVHGRYRLESVIGRGGMATVYAARHTVTGRRVAVKLLHPRPDWSASEVERLLREARISARLGHPNVIEIVDAGTDDDGAPFIAMELLDGESLRARLERVGHFEVADALRVASAVLSALSAAHEAGVVHRDVKPENVFLARRDGGDERVLLLDFGISKVLKTHNGSIAPSTLTETGAIVGTVAYMSPEQLRGDDLDGRTDLWATGVLLFEMLSGRTPFTGKTPALLTMAVLMARAPSLDRSVRGLPRPLVSLVSSLLAPRREERPANASTALASLEALRELPMPAEVQVLPPSLEPAPASAPPTRDRRWIALVAALALSLGVTSWRARASSNVATAPRRTTSTTIAPPANLTAETSAPMTAADASLIASHSDAAIAPAPPVARRAPTARPPRSVGHTLSPLIAPAATSAHPRITGPMQPATDLDGT